MPRRLFVLDGADQGRCYALPEAGAVILGSSDRHCDIVLNDLYTARAHCEIEVKGEEVTLTDLATPSGTFVNKQKVQKHPLALNDVIRIGNTQLRYELGEVPAAGQAPQRVQRDPAALPHVGLEQLAELSGHTLGHFKLGDVIGQGHVGTVFKARDLKTGHEVALKVLGPTFPKDDGEMQRFVQVLKTLLPLRHPNLVALLGAGRVSHYCWIARELVEVESAAQIIARHHKQKSIDWHVGFRLAMHIGRALEFAARHHLSHLNVTPANILIGADGVARLNDLMMHKALDGTQLQQETLEKKFLADLPWIAPEQTDPEAYVDDLADLHRLGAIVYAVLTGHKPFSGKDPERLIEQIRNELPEKLKRYQKHIPLELQAVVLRLLAKHPEERFANAAQMLAELVPIGEREGLRV